MQYVNKLFESDVFKAVVNSKFFKVLGIDQIQILTWPYSARFQIHLVAQSPC